MLTTEDRNLIAAHLRRCADAIEAGAPIGRIGQPYVNDCGGLTLEACDEWHNATEEAEWILERLEFDPDTAGEVECCLLIPILQGQIADIAPVDSPGPEWKASLVPVTVTVPAMSWRDRNQRRST